MTFIDHHDVGRRHIAPLQRLYARHLHRHAAIGLTMIRLDHADIADALAGEHLEGLVDQADSRNAEQNFLVLAACTVDKLGSDHRLAAARRTLHYDMKML